jgi:hypothetical protein
MLRQRDFGVPLVSSRICMIWVRHSIYIRSKNVMSLIVKSLVWIECLGVVALHAFA